MLLKNRTPLFVALVLFVTTFLIQTTGRFLMSPPSGRVPSLPATLIYLMNSGVLAWIFWADRRNALKRPTAARKWTHWLGLLLLVILAFLIYQLASAIGAQ
jgi:hypothetical protein